MKAITLTISSGITVQDVPRPEKAEPEHIIIKMSACAINPGDKAFISRPLPPGAVLSLHDVYGVSGAGTVIASGAGVPELYEGKKVSIYRSLRPSKSIVGTWCEYTHMHFLDCVILPDDADLDDYSGSLVNIITPYAFLQQILAEGHKGIISTAGSSATGLAMVGICSAYDFPLISIVRNEDGKRALEAVGAKHVVAQSDNDFAQQLKDVAARVGATAIFDGVGGQVLNKIVELLPNGSTIYSYGYLGDDTPLIVHTLTLTAKGITIKPFGNFMTDTVRNPQSLEKALKDIAGFIHLPHFKTKGGQKFRLEEINDALQFVSGGGEKAILCP